jgi:ribonuclease P protein component
MPLPFGQDRRLRKHPEFARAQRTGRRVTTPHFALLVAAQFSASGTGADASARAPSRLGVVVSRKIGGAVERNRVKRLCRECFRTWPELLPPGVDLVVIARPGAHELGLAGVRGEWLAVERLLRKRAAEALARASTTHHPPPDRGRPVDAG